MARVIRGKTKRCTICKHVKPLSEYHRNKNNKDGFLHQCKPCELVRGSCYVSAATASAGSARVRRDVRVFTSPCARTERNTSMCGGSPSRST